MPPLPPETLPVVPHFTWWIFNIAYPNLITIIAVIVIFLLAVWLKLPKIFDK